MRLSHGLITRCSPTTKLFIILSLLSLGAIKGGGASAPSDATYITQTTNATLTDEQALGTLATGYMKSSTTTGVITTQAVPIPVADGGTGAATFTANGVLLGNGTGAMAVTGVGTANQVLVIPGAGGAPAFGTVALGSAAGVSGTLPLARGGTDNATTAIGTLLVGSSLSWQKLAVDTTATRYLANTGAAGILTAWDQVNLANGVTGTLPVGNGGTGVATLAANGVLYGNGTGAVLVTAQGGTNTILTASAGAPSFSATPIINTSAQLGVASTTTGSLKLGHALSANLTTLQAGNATAAVTYVLPTADGTNTQQLTTNGSGVLSWTAQGSGTALSSITAATAANTIANGTNTGQVWNWAPTADSVNAFTFGETTAATGGTSTSGVPNQVLLRINTLAASTMSPLSVYSGGSHVFSVSPSSSQVFCAAGTAVLPAYAFALDPGTGIYRASSNILGFAAGATNPARIGANGLQVANGTPSSPSVTNIVDQGSGLLWPTPTTVAVTVNTVENTRFDAGIAQISKGTGDTVSYAINARKARGSVISPTVITTGDDLLTENGYGYVGATNTYVQATEILHDSTGTIADTTTGIGGQIKMLTRTVGKALVNRVILNGNVDLTENVAATIVTIPLASLEMAGGTVVYSIDASDGTDMVSVSGQVDFAAVNKGGVYTTNSNVVGTETIANSDPTITVTTTFGFSNGVNQTSFQITSSMTRVPTAFTTTTRRCTYQVISGAQQSVTAP